MFYNMKDSEIRSVCRDRIEALEHWLRRLIDDTLTPVYGDYFNYTDEKGNRLISSKLSEQVDDRRQKEPTRYPRKIDAVLLDDAVAIVCKPQLFNRHFRQALEGAFPHGEAEARTFLSRLLTPRNNLAHANAISSRQAEQIICYSNDVIDSLKTYYTALGMQQDYNVPLIMKVMDSFGNVFTRNEFCDPSYARSQILFIQKPEFFLRPGDILSVEVEIDPSFDPESYTLTWKTVFDTFYNHPKVLLPITEREVGQNFYIECTVTSNKEWHRLTTCDDEVTIAYKVLPPVS
jgi:hypothetical protein